MSEILSPYEARYMYFHALNRRKEFSVLKDLLCMDDARLCKYIGIDAPPSKSHGNRVVDSDTLAQMIELANRGYTVPQIAAATGCSQNRVHDMLKYQQRAGNVRSILWPQRMKSNTADLPTIPTQQRRPIRRVD